MYNRETTSPQWNDGIQSKTDLGSKIDLGPPFSYKNLHFQGFLARSTRMEERKIFPVIPMYNRVNISPRETMEFNQKLILARKLTLKRDFLHKPLMFWHFWPEIRG